MKYNYVLPLLISSLSLLSPQAWADNTLAPTPNNQTNYTHQTPWLGVILANVPDALSAQLSGLIPKGQGVLVQSVIPNSPAAKAGIQKNDVLLNFGDQKLYSPSQLSGLVQAASIDSQTDMQVVSQGKLKTVTVKIEGRQVATNATRSPFWQRFGSPRLVPPVNGKSNNSLAWDSFESVQVKTLSNGNYHAEVSFKDKNNETKSFTFEGKRDEIIKQIQNQKDLPDDKRKALLNALNMRPDQSFRSLFNDPFFQSNPFDDPFFKNMMPNINIPFPQFFQQPLFANPPAPSQPLPLAKPKERIAL